MVSLPSSMYVPTSGNNSRVTGVGNVGGTQFVNLSTPQKAPTRAAAAPGGGGSPAPAPITTNNNTDTTQQNQQQQQAYSDPYARWGGASAYNSLKSGFDNQKNAVYGSARDAASNTGIGLRNSILDLVDSLRTGQQAVDNRGINNDLARQRGVADIYGSVSRGIQSGGVQLANKNASDSSAAGAIARAYGSIGQRQLSDVGNQYELENQEIGLAQEDLGRQSQSGLRKIQGSKEQAVNSIVADAQNSLAALDAAMANASLPERIAIDAEKNAIRSEVMNSLSAYDGQLNEGVSSVRAMDPNARMAEATRRGSLGMASDKAFQYDTEAPTQFQGTGPFASQLPIFTYRGREDQ